MANITSLLITTPEQLMIAMHTYRIAETMPTSAFLNLLLDFPVPHITEPASFLLRQNNLNKISHESAR